MRGSPAGTLGGHLQLDVCGGSGADVTQLCVLVQPLLLQQNKHCVGARSERLSRWLECW
jgi:hypothetical protein